MAETKLEIKVFDEVIIADSLEKAVTIILEAFKKWIESKDKRPFKLKVKRVEGRAPPALSISVEETVKTVTTLA